MTNFDPNWPHGHQTRDGRKARIICTDRKQSGYQIIALAGDFDADIICARYDGRTYEHHDSKNDLINSPAPKRKLEAWVNFYEDGAPGCGYATREEAAQSSRGGKRIACLHVTGEEGDGL